VFSGPLLEIIATLLFVFVAMSAIVSTAGDMVIGGAGWRVRNLRKTIEHMLQDETYGLEIARRVYRHPLINGVGVKKQITYIEPETFVVALATAVQPEWSHAEPVAELPYSVDALKSGALRERLKLIIPPADVSGDRREAVRGAILAWFDTSIRKSQERFKADTRMMSFMIAALATVTLNVSPIEITQRLLNDAALRSSLAAVATSLAPTAANGASSSGGLAAIAPTQSVEPAPLALSSPEAQLLLTALSCRKAGLSLPIGWPWMMAGLDRINSNPVVSRLLADGSDICPADVSPTGASADFGPSFETDPPLVILLGWLITVVAAAQGAPFWFNMIQKLMRR
jgi:hypothetical protein